MYISKGVYLEEAFKNQLSIISVNFGGECTFVEKGAFENCLNLGAINSSNVLLTLGESAFARTILSSVVFDELTQMSSCAFEQCTMLKEVSMPNCSIIGESVFKSCKSLETIKINLNAH